MTTQPTTTAAATVQAIALDRLRHHPLNVRIGLSDLRDLAASIRRHGVLQPLLVERLLGAWRPPGGEPC